jgi:hypothetical protein
VTTLNTAAAWQKTKPLAIALCASWLAFGLAGCETAASLFSSAKETPTASVAAPPSPTAAASRPAQIAVAPVIGPPEAVSKQLQDQLVADIERQNIRVAKAGEPAQYTLRGYVVSSIDKKGARAKISYIWDVTDGTGKGVHRVSGEQSAPSGKSRDPWTAVTPPVVEAITAKTVSSITAWLPAQGPAPVASNARPNSGLVQTAAATPASYQPPATPPHANTVTGSIATPGAIRARVPSVMGAPGDGSASLRLALQRELSRNGVALSESPSPDTYTVEGRVAMGTSNNGKQPITIDWSVSDPSGKKLGSVSQKNEVPQGSLDGAWGKTADAAAAAAAQGILKLLPQRTQTSSAN